jgi:hypothetical protein
LALITVLVIAAVLAGLMVLGSYLTVSDLQHSRSDLAISRTLAAAQAGENYGAALLSGPVRSDLNSVVESMDSKGEIGNSGTWAFDPGSSGSQPDPGTVATNLATVGQNLQSALPGKGCVSGIPLGSSEQLTLQISFVRSNSTTPDNLPSCGNSPALKEPLAFGAYLSGAANGQQTYSLPYTMVVTATSATAHRRTLVIGGQYDFTLGAGSFSRYASFTNAEQAGGGINFLNGSYLYDGPVHTNGNFAFAGSTYSQNVPGSGQVYFGGPVSSAGVTDAGRPGAWYYTRGAFRFFSPSRLSPPSKGNTQPDFTQGVDWNAADIPFPTNSNNQKVAAENSGLLFSSGLYSLELYAGGPAGNPLTLSSGQWVTQSGGTLYQYIKACSTAVNSGICPTPTLYRYTQNGPLQQQGSGGTWTNLDSSFNGVIYTAGNVHRLLGPPRSNPTDPASAPPAVASFAQLNVTAEGDVRITGDLKYQNDPCNGALQRNSNGTVQIPTCATSGPLNVLGIYSSGGSGKHGVCNLLQQNGVDYGGGTICLGNGSAAGETAPTNLTVDASLMATNTVDQENWNTVSPTQTGRFSLLGGVIDGTDGIYGYANPSGGLSTGVLTSFTYDPRLGNGLTPPYFPTTTSVSVVTSAQPIVYQSSEQQVP